MVAGPGQGNNAGKDARLLDLRGLLNLSGSDWSACSGTLPRRSDSGDRSKVTELTISLFMIGCIVVTTSSIYEYPGRSSQEGRPKGATANCIVPRPSDLAMARTGQRACTASDVMRESLR